MALRKGNAFWTGWGSKTTVGHVRDRQGVPKKEVSTERYKGFRIYESADGWTVPELDRGSLFESKREVKRFIDFEVKNMARNPRRRKRNAQTWHTITARMVGKYLEGFGHVLARDVGKKYYVQDGSYFVENDAQMAARLGKAVNPRTLVPAKLKMMPNGKIVVLLSPGAMAKMRVGNPTRYGDLYTVYRKEGRYSWEQTGHNFSSKSDANGQITIWKRGDRRDPPPYPKYKIVKLVKEYSR